MGAGTKRKRPVRRRKRPFVPLLDESLEYIDPSNDTKYVSKNPFEWFEVKHVMNHLVDPFTMLSSPTSRSEGKRTTRKKTTKAPPVVEEDCPDLLMAQYKYWQQRFFSSHCMIRAFMSIQLVGTLSHLNWWHCIK